MKTSYRRSQPSGFSLIELLVVVAIIVILAGMTLAGMAFVQQNVARKKADVQIHLLSSAIQDYYSDNRKYPENDEATGESGSQVLYKALYQDGYDAKNNSNSTSSTSAKIYLDKLDPIQNKEGKGEQAWVRSTAGGGTAQIIDPWGNPYLYRTGKNALNPDFDLWSKGKDGKTDPSDPKGKNSRDDVSNFH